MTPPPSGLGIGRLPNEAPLPVETVRDLLALTRALYATFQKMGHGYDAQLLKLQGIGYQLALEKAARGGPGTFAHRSAWLIAEKAVADLGGLVDVYLPAKALITATGERLMKKR